MRRSLVRVLCCGLLAAMPAVAGCGEDDADSGGSGGGAGVDQAAAKAAVEKYSGKPSAFPVDQPLEKRP